MANYPQELAQDAVCQSHTGHVTGLWFLPARPLRLNTNEWMNEKHMLSTVTPPPENRAVYEIMWKDTVQPDRPQMTIWRMRTACWIPKDTNTHSEYIILVTLPLQQWLHERVSVFHYTYIACLISSCPQRPSTHQFCKYQRIFAGAERIDLPTR